MLKESTHIFALKGVPCVKYCESKEKDKCSILNKEKFMGKIEDITKEEKNIKYLCEMIELFRGVDKVYYVYALNPKDTIGYEVDGFNGDTLDCIIDVSYIAMNIIEWMCNRNITISIDYNNKTCTVRVLYNNKNKMFLNRKFTSNHYDLDILLIKAGLYTYDIWKNEKEM